MKRIILFLLLAVNATALMAEIKTEEFQYSVNGVNMNGFIAWDASSDEKRPGVVVVHEWWGVTDYPRKRAEMLAEAGYTAIAIDMYGEGKIAGHPQDAQKFMGELLADLPGSRERFNAGLDQLKAHPTVNTGQIAAIGYCLGGGVVLHMARYGADLAAVASFHGSLPLSIAPDETDTKITARVVAYNGEDDPFVTADDIAGFKAEMDQAGADYQFINYPGSVHGFTNPNATSNGEEFSIPLKYNALADQSSWDHMLLLFESVFKAENE
jgi:dienelactone hydrolase